MPISKKQEETAQYLSELLVQSSLDENLKELIMEKIDQLPEGMIMNLLEALESEGDQLKTVSAKVEEFIENQAAGWDEIEKEQQDFADKFIGDATQHLDDQTRIQELKDSI